MKHVSLNPFKNILLAALAISSLHMTEAVAGGSTTTATEEKGRKIKMDDGRELTFGEKTRMQKEYGIVDANVFARIDFDNGKVVTVVLPAGNLVKHASYTGEDADKKLIAALADTSLKAMGHGLIQKLGDAAAGAESTDDALEAILEVAGRLSKGEWKKTGDGGGTAKGAGLLVSAMHEYLQETTNPAITKDQTREMLSALSPAEKSGLMKLEAIAAKIEKLKAEKAPSKREQEQKKNSESVLAAITGAVKDGKPLELPKKDEAPAAGEPATA